MGSATYRISRRVLRKLKAGLFSDQATPLLGLCLKEMKRYLLPALTTAKAWRRPEGPQTDTWLREMWYRRSGIVLNYNVFKIKKIKNYFNL